MKTLAEIKARLEEIVRALNREDITDEDLDALKKESDELLETKRQLTSKIEKREKIIGAIAGGAIGTPVESGALPAPVAVDERTKRAEEFARTSKMIIPGREARSILLSGGTIATPTKVSGINDLPGGVCSIIDMVSVADCTGMSGNKVAYVVSESSASATTEGSASTTSEPTFGYLTISPEDYSLISYISKQIRRQSPLDYESKVRLAAFKALRRKGAAIITNSIKSSTIADEIIASQITATTLRTIAFSYGPEDEVDGNCVLFLNKKDLIAFGDVRGTNEKKPVYEIIASAQNPNTGVIKDGGLTVNYCIDPYCDHLTGGTNSSTTATKPTMLYGVPLTVELDLFGGYEISVSEDYKFAEGLLAVRGEMAAGADLTVKGGMMKVSIAKSS